VPQARGELEAFAPCVAELDEDPETAARFGELRRSREELQVKKFIAEHVPAMKDVRNEWQGSYYHGRPPGRAEVEDHQTRLRLRAFERRNGTRP
jgi:hypothetical protein